MIDNLLACMIESSQLNAFNQPYKRHFAGDFLFEKIFLQMG